MVQVQDTLETVESSNLERRSHWVDRIEYFSGQGDRACSWTRETFESDLRELRSEISQVDNRIGELEKSIGDKVQQIRNRLESYDEISEAGLEKLESKGLADGGNATHGVNKVQVFGNDWPDSVDTDTLVGLHRKRAVFQEIKSTLRKIGLSKLEDVALGYKKDFVSGEVADTVQEDVREQMDQIADKLDLQMDNKLTTATADLESKIKVLNSRLNQVEKQLDQENTASNGGDDGLDDLDIDTESEDNEDSRVEEPEITETEKSHPEYSLEGKSLEEQRDVIREIAENEPVYDMTATEVADKTDVTRQKLTVSILPDLEEEYGIELNFGGG